jgi:hypothetical protein
MDAPQLPMSMANIPAQADPRIALAGRPAPEVDTLGETNRAYSLSSQMNRNEDEMLAKNDRQLIQQALQQGANMSTPDGIDSLAKDLKGKVQPGTYESLIKAKSTLEESALKVQDKMASLDEAKLATMQKQSDVVLKSMSGLLEEFETTKKDRGLDVAVNEFGAKKDATLKALADSGVVPPQVIQQMQGMSPTQLKSLIQTSKFWQDQMKAAADLKEKSARAAKEDAQTKAIESGGAQMVQLQALEDKYGADSKEVQDWKKRNLQARPPAGSGIEATMTPDAIDLAAERLLKGDKTALQNIGRGVQGAANITAINNRVASLAKERGIDANSVLKAQAELGAATKGLRDLAGRSAKIDAAVIEVDKFADNALESLEKVSRGNTVPLNEIIRRVELGTGSPEEAAFATYVKSLASAYANVIGRGTTTVFSQTEADKIIRKDYSKDQFRAMVDALKKEAVAVQDSSRGAGENIKRETFGDPKLDPKAQAVRDKDRVGVLQNELKKAEARRDELATKDQNDEAVKDANQANSRDIAQLRKELKLGAETKKAAAKKAPPEKNEKGWELHKDKSGNLAYVSPDGKQFEEVK